MIPNDVPVHKTLNHFIAIGTNFLKADTATRSRFAITEEGSAKIYEDARVRNFHDFFILSTCNRTEFYGCVPSDTLKEFVSCHLGLSEADVQAYFYTYSGKEAARHFFRVVAGLDSQILGDYEIVGQVKSALEKSRSHHLVGTITDRVSNFAFQASKKIKAQTNLSSGKYSVSYAASEWMLHQDALRPLEKILLVGTGDFGSSMAHNIRHHFPEVKLAMVNRTAEKAEKLARQLKASVIPFGKFRNHLHEFDTVITTVGNDRYLIQPSHVHPGKPRLFLDLSVPQAVNPEIKRVPGVRLFSLDEVSAYHNELLNHRKREIPRAEQIVDLFIDRLMEWHQVYCHRHVVLGYKEKIQDLVYGHCSGFAADAAPHPDKRIEKTFSHLIHQIKTQGFAGCLLIEAMDNLVPSK